MAAKHIPPPKRAMSPGPGPNSRGGEEEPSPPSSGGGADELHFRMDEHERNISELQQLASPQHLAGLVHGIVAALKAQDDDAEEDEEVVKALEKQCECLDRVCQSLDRLCAALQTDIRRDR